MKMEVDIKVFTLNVWGIVGISKNRSERIKAIAAHLAGSDYDFVFLQEVWSQEDYKYLCRKMASVLPYTHYFYSGVIGGGVCIFSKSRIQDTAMHKYSLNGYAHKLQHGDWFGGKVAGLCKVIHAGLHINLYVSHLHAEYNHVNDQYLPHRVAQAFEFSQFIQMTSNSADLCIVAGDFNTEPTDLVYKIILHNTGCHDAFLTQSPINELQNIGATCGHPRNIFSTKAELKDYPPGRRLDYILFKFRSGTFVQTISCETPLDKIPGTILSYSDHEAVVAQLHVTKSAEVLGSYYESSSRCEAIEEAHDLLIANLSSLKNDRIFYFIMSCLIICLLLVSVPFEVPYGFWTLLICLRVILSIALAFSIWMGVIMNKIEQSALLSAAMGMKVLLESFKCDDDSLCVKPDIGRFEIN